MHEATRENRPFRAQRFSRACGLQQTAASDNNLVKYAALQSCSERELCSNVTKASGADYSPTLGVGVGGGVVSCKVPSKQGDTHFPPRPGIPLNVRVRPPGRVKGRSSSEAAGARLLSARTEPPSAGPGSEDTINLAVR